MGKSIKKKQQEYINKYGDIPKDNKERLEWMWDKYNLNPNVATSILQKRRYIIESIYYTSISIILYQIPEGAKRPRYRFINRSNILDSAKQARDFIHVYSPDASTNNQYMKRMLSDNEIDGLHELICTPCDVEFRAYFPTPSYYNREQVFIAEMGLDRHIYKPDFDNIAKLYSDMYNSNVWLDDRLTIRGVVEKYYSILPRVEIDLKYMNTLFNKKQWEQITSSVDYPQGLQIDYIDYKK